MRLIYALLSGSLLISCNVAREDKLSPPEISALHEAAADSLTLNIDSLLQVRIPVRPLYDKPELYDDSAAVKFKALASATNGAVSLIAQPELLVKQIGKIIAKHGQDGADLLILMDKTGSMDNDIEMVKQGLGSIIGQLEKFRNLRLAIALYGDHNVDNDAWFSYRNFETDYAAAGSFIDSIAVTGGGDTPESVYEGFFAAAEKGFWRSATKRMVLLIGDAPPLEAPLSKYTMADVIGKAHEQDIIMNFYPILIGIGSTVDTPEAPVPYTDAAATGDKLFAGIYPVPSNGHISMDLNTTAMMRVEVFDANGRRILEDRSSGSRWQHDFSALPDGVYLVRVSGDHRFQAGRFILKH